ncbi:hypothetical protein ES703_89306 [subsurface metagenome]
MEIVKRRRDWIILMADEDIIKLYISFKEVARGWLSLHRQHFTQFVAIILAVLAASSTAFFYLKGESWLLLIVVLGPALNIWLSVLAIKVCDKFYLRYVEHDAVSAKLYFILEESKEINSRVEATKEILPGDSHLFAQRWLERIKDENCGTSGEFAERRLHARDSSNRFIRITFRLFIGLSIVVAVVIMAVAAWNIFTRIA